MEVRGGASWLVQGDETRGTKRFRISSPHLLLYHNACLVYVHSSFVTARAQRNRQTHSSVDVKTKRRKRAGGGCSYSNPFFCAMPLPTYLWYQALEIESIVRVRMGGRR
jgi:hypothetical protein